MRTGLGQEEFATAANPIAANGIISATSSDPEPGNAWARPKNTTGGGSNMIASVLTVFITAGLGTGWEYSQWGGKQTLTRAVSLTT